jgi:hypothetical protein
MAQEISDIQQEIIDDLVAKAAAAGVVLTPDEWSDYDYRQLLTFVDAVAAGTVQQLWDAYQTDVDKIVSAASPQTGAWFQSQMLKFQFDAITPQIIQFDTVNFAPYYPTVDTTLRVIKYCSVVSGAFGITIIKVAAEAAGVPVKLDTAHAGAEAAAQSYVNVIAVPGLSYLVVSNISDKIFIQASIYYQGGYSAVIQDTVIAAIEAYLAGIPFNGVVLLSGISDAIQAVPGVNDVTFQNVQARANGTAYGAGTNLVIASTVVARKWDTDAGYVIPETDTGHELTDSLTFIPE